MILEAGRQCAKDRKEWKARVPLRSAMPLHDAVRVNCKNGATAENQGAGVKDMG